MVYKFLKYPELKTLELDTLITDRLVWISTVWTLLISAYFALFPLFGYLYWSSTNASCLIKWRVKFVIYRFLIGCFGLYKLNYIFIFTLFLDRFNLEICKKRRAIIDLDIYNPKVFSSGHSFRNRMFIFLKMEDNDYSIVFWFSLHFCFSIHNSFFKGFNKLFLCVLQVASLDIWAMVKST